MVKLNCRTQPTNGGKEHSSLHEAFDVPAHTHQLSRDVKYTGVDETSETLSSGSDGE